MADGSPLYRIRHPKKRAFLAAYRNCGSIRRACEAAGIARGSYYIWTEHDETFALAARQALLEAGEALELEARRRATEGVRKEKPIFYLGNLLTTVIETDYSDTLLIFLLKGAMPEKYRERLDLTQTQVVKTMDREAWEAV